MTKFNTKINRKEVCKLNEYMASLCRFNALDFLSMFRGKKILFVGDSLSLNQWQSLTCMLHAAVPQAEFTIQKKGNLSTFTFPVSIPQLMQGFCSNILQEL